MVSGGDVGSVERLTLRTPLLGQCQTGAKVEQQRRASLWLIVVDETAFLPIAVWRNVTAAAHCLLKLHLGAEEAEGAMEDPFHLKNWVAGEAEQLDDVVRLRSLAKHIGAIGSDAAAGLRPVVPFTRASRPRSSSAASASSSSMSSIGAWQRRTSRFNAT